MPFNVDFAREREQYLIGLVREQVGCFNAACREPTAKKRCSQCQVAVYCSKDCQVAEWKGGHKPRCKLYCQNTAKDTRPNGNGQRGSVAIALYSIGLIDDDTLSKAMCDRASCFLEEAKKVIDVIGFGGFRKPTIHLEICCIYDMEKIRFVGAAKFHDKGSADRYDFLEVNHVIFEVVSDESGEAVRRRLHPPGGGSGDISEECRRKVIEELYLFVCLASQDHGVAIQGITFGRGLMWMNDAEFKKSVQFKRLDEANDIEGKHRILWMPDFGYVQEDAMAKMSSAFQGL